MITAVRPSIEDLEPKDIADLRARREPVKVTASPKTGWHNDTLERFDDIQINASHRVLIPPSSEGLAGRLWLIVGALIAAGGWVVISVLPLPFALTAIDKPRASSATSADASDSMKRDRLAIPNATIRKPVFADSREKSPNIVAPAPSQHQSPEAQRQTIGPATETPRHTTPMRARARDLEPSVKLVPVPETKPATIEGWTLRDVTNGRAVLEGPSGTWRVARGDMVPGLGRVDSIFQWGNRLMVATSKGLVSTP